MGKDRSIIRSARIGLAAIAFTTVGCGEIYGKATDTIIVPPAALTEPPPTAVPLKPKYTPEQELVLKNSAEIRTIMNPELSAWRQNLPENTIVSVSVFTNPITGTIIPSDGVGTRLFPDTISEKQFPSYPHGKPVEKVKMMMTVQYPDSKVYHGLMVDEKTAEQNGRNYVTGNFIASSITSSAAKGSITETFIKTDYATSEIHSFLWTTNGLAPKEEEPSILTLFGREPTIIVQESNSRNAEKIIFDRQHQTQR